MNNVDHMKQLIQLVESAEHLVEAPNNLGKAGYGLEGKPDWYDRAVKMKMDNPDITANEIARQVGVSQKGTIVRYWLTGKGHANYKDRPHTKDWPPFKPEDFPNRTQFKPKYFDGAKPEWYNKAVQLKKNNPNMSIRQIAKQVGTEHGTVSRWLTGRKMMSKGRIIPYNPNPPFSIEDFYKAPEWLPDAEKLKTDNPNMTAVAIGKKLGVDVHAILNWLTGELPAGRGKVGANVPGYKPKFSRADFARTANQRIKTIADQVNTMLANNLSDQQIIKQIADQYGKQFASDIKSRLPVLRQALRVRPDVTIDKTTGTDITGMRIGDLSAGK